MSAAYYRVGALYYDTSGHALYICTTAGDKTSSVWQLISGAGGGSLPQQFKIVSDQGDYLYCNTWDGTTTGIINVIVVKPFKLRPSITTESIGGVTHSYTYTTDAFGRKVRTNSYSSVSETELITPDYLAGDVIYASACAQTVGSSIPTAVASVSLVSGGTGYAVNDVLTLAGGTGTKATIKVLTVSSGVIATYSLQTSGLYTANPTLSANAPTGGAGSSATFNVTMAGQLFDLNADGRAWAT